MRNEEENSWAYCAGCPVGGCENGDILENTDYLVRGAMDLIHRLQDENGKQKAEIERLKKRHGVALLRNDDLDLENYELKKQVDELNAELEKAYEIERANIQAEIAEAGTSCHWCKEQAVKDTAKEILQELYDQIDENTPKWVGVQIKIIAKRKGVEVE